MAWKPTLGGSLAIFNALSLVGLAVLAREMRAYQTLVVVWMCILSFPLAMCCFTVLSSGHSGGATEIVLLGVGVGLNALLWGHGVAWLLRRTILVHFAPAPSSHAEDEDDPPDGPPPS